MGTLRYGVVTRVPDVEKGDAGNMAWSPIYQLAEKPSESNGYLGRVAPVFDLSLRVPVFEHREPGKWDVDVAMYDTIDAAMAHARNLEG